MEDKSRHFGWPGRNVEASGIASVAIAGNNLAPVSTQVFLGDWFPLLQAYLDPSSLDTQIQSAEFTGREWLFREIDKFILDNSSGYFIVEADAGLGKTAFACELAQRGKHAAHFVSLDHRAKSSESAIRNISAQLIAAWNLTALAPQGMLPPGADTPSWLWLVLGAVAEQRDRVDPMRPVILVVDGLDEAETPLPGSMPLGLPIKLPPGFFVVATTRTGTALPALRQPYRTQQLVARSATNEWDMKRYLRKQSREPWLSRQIEASGADEVAVLHQLLERCAGVWIYLNCVLSEIRYGLRRLDQIRDLPADLEGYYSVNIKQLSERDDWINWYLPLLATLGVAAEPLDCAQLAKFAGIENAERIHRFLLTRFRPFCSVRESAGEEKFALYHRSLAEFLSGKVSASTLTGNQALTAEFRRATRAAHERICNYSLAVWGEVSECFPTLAENLDLAELAAGYPVKYLVHHLSAAGCPEDIDALLSARRQSRNTWYEAHEQIGDWDGYLRDLQVAQRIAQQKTDAAQETSVLAPTLGTEYRYALMSSSITSQVGRIPAALLATLVSTGTWPIRRSLSHIRRIGDRTARTAAYIAVIPYLAGPQRSLAWREALASSAHIDNVKSRSNMLVRLSHIVPRNQQGRILEKAYETGGMEPWKYRTEILSAFCRNINANLVDAAFYLAIKVPDEAARARCLVALISKLGAQLMSSALAAIDNIGSENLRGQLLLALLAGKSAKGYSAEILARANAFNEQSVRAKVLATVARLLNADEAAEVVFEAIRSAQNISDSTVRAPTLAYVAGQLEAGELRNKLINDSLSLVQNARDLESRVEMVDQICKEIGAAKCKSVLFAIFEEIDQSDDSDLIISATATLAPHLPRKKAAIALRKALKSVVPISDIIERKTALTAIAEEWPAVAHPMALSFAQRIDIGPSWIEFVSPLLPRMEQSLLHELVLMAESFSVPAYRRRFARALAPYVPDELVGRVLDLISIEKGENVLYEPDSAQLYLRDSRDIDRELLRSDRSEQMRYRQLRSRYLAEECSAAVLASLAPRLSEPLRQRAIQDSLALRHSMLRLKTLIAFLPYVDGEVREDIAHHALAAADFVLSEIDDNHSAMTRGDSANLSEVFGDLFRALPKDLGYRRGELFARLIMQDPLSWRLGRVSRFFAGFPEGIQTQLKDDLLYSLWRFPETRSRLNSLISVLPVSGNRQSEIAVGVAESASRIDGVPARAKVYAALAPYLPDDALKLAIDSTLRDAAELEDEAQRVAATVELVPLMNGPDEQPVLDDIIVLATTITSVAERCGSLISLLPALSEERRKRVFTDVMAAIRGLTDINERYNYILSVDDVASQAERALLLDEVVVLPNESLRGQAVARLSAGLSEASIPKALAISKAIIDEKSRVSALAELCPRLASHDLEELIRSALDIEDGRNRVVLLRAITQARRSLSVIPGSISMRQWADALDRPQMLDLISFISPYIAKSSGVEGLLEVADAILDVTLWWP